jgi:uncharacterized protein involved in exopolysaccharide biosynthesis
LTSNELVPTEREDEVEAFALLRIMWSYKFLIAFIMAACTAVAVVFALSATPIYRAEVTVTEARESNMSSAASLSNQLGGIVGLAGFNLGQSGGLGREARAVLQSRHLVEEFVRRNSLLPVLALGSKAPTTLWRCVEQFRKGVLVIHEDRLSGITTVAVDWTDPVVAARWANGFVAVANDLIRDRALNDSTRNVAYLNEQLAKTDILEVRRVMFSLIESETKTLMLANARSEYAFTVVDPAVPPEIRERPRRTLIVLAGVLVGFFAGTICALLRAIVLDRQRRGISTDR